MRPGAASTAGFLGSDERLLDVLVSDNDYVVDQLKLTHQELALHLRAVAAIGQKRQGALFLYHGQRLKVTLRFSRGFQESPFGDGTRANSEATVENLTNGKKIEFSLLVPDMIERYGFYEGKGTSYRVAPRDLAAVFDFVRKDKK